MTPSPSKSSTREPQQSRAQSRSFLIHTPTPRVGVAARSLAPSAASSAVYSLDWASLIPSPPGKFSVAAPRCEFATKQRKFTDLHHTFDSMHCPLSWPYFQKLTDFKVEFMTINWLTQQFEVRLVQIESPLSTLKLVY